MHLFQERERYREPVADALKTLLALNWVIEYDSLEGSAGKEQVIKQDQVSFAISLLIMCKYKKTFVELRSQDLY